MLCAKVMRLWILFALPWLVCACTQRETPKGDMPAARASSPPAASNSVEAGAVDASDATLVGDAGEAGDVLEPVLLADDGAPLPQTDAMPSLQSHAYQARLDMLWRAIVRDEPALADDVFFPLVAYEQVKAIAKPAADWKARLMSAFARDIHAYHKKLGENPERARFLRLDVPADKIKWMAPGTEGNKLGYYRVLHSTLRYVDGDGKERSLDVTSMISWRGEWFVVHMAGFK